MNTPTLRFKEFSGAWEVKKLGAETTWGSGGTPSKQEESYWDGDIPWISASSMRGFKYFDSDLKITNAGLSNGSRLATTGSLLLLVRGSMLFNKIPVGIATKDVAFNQDVKSIKTKPSINNEFLLYWFFASENKLLNMVSGTGIGAGKLDTQDLLAMDLSIPTLPEQTKIANFLTAIDEKIAQLSQTAQLLTDYKKGVMQQIFSQQLRFKDDDGREFSEWEVKKFGDVFRFFNTNSFSRDLLTYEDEEVKNIHYGDIHTKFKTNFIIENEAVPFIKKDVDISKISEDCYCKEGDLIIADASEDYADVGKSIEIIRLNNQKLLAGLHTYIARPAMKKMALGFSGYLMQTENIRLQIKTLATGASVLGISKTNMAKVNLKIPSLPEQTKIAIFLTAIDDKINHNQTQLDAMKQYKAGLLQQMFV